METEKNELVARPGIYSPGQSCQAENDFLLSCEIQCHAIFQIHAVRLPAEKVQVQQWMAKTVGRFYGSLLVLLQDLSSESIL